MALRGGCCNGTRDLRRASGGRCLPTAPPVDGEAQASQPVLNFLCNLCGFLQQDLLARFCKESSLAKQEMLPDIGTRIFYKGGGFALWPHLSPLPMVFSPSGTTGRGALFRMMLTRSHGLGTAAREFGGEGGADHAAVAGLSWEAKTPCRASHRRGLLCKVWLFFLRPRSCRPTR